MNQADRSRTSGFLYLAGETAVVNYGIPEGIEAADHPERIRSKKDTTARRHAEIGLRVVTYRERVEQLEKIDEGRDEQFFPKALREQLRHDRNKNERLIDQLSF